jgi:hypothetical protein
MVLRIEPRSSNMPGHRARPPALIWDSCLQCAPATEEMAWLFGRMASILNLIKSLFFLKKLLFENHEHILIHSMCFNDFSIAHFDASHIFVGDSLFRLAACPFDMTHSFCFAFLFFH